MGSSTRCHLKAGAVAIGCMLTLTAGVSSARAFDLAGYKARLEATKAELATKTLSDSKATLARLDEMVRIGEAGCKEYGDAQPKFAKLMAAVNANADTMKMSTDAE